MKTISPQDLSVPDFYRLLNSSIAPRPIAFVSTISKEGHVNLSPYSFFNIFGFNPPMLVFSPSRNRHGHKKHALLNVEEVPEVTINVVSHRMVEQMSLASAEFDRHVNEFDKAGFTPLPSERVVPPRVAEAPVSYECVVRQLVPLGDAPGAGTLVVCEVVLAHFHDEIFDANGQIDPFRIDLVGRLGADWYVRANDAALFEVARPQMGVGVDQIPLPIRNSNILTGNDLGRLGSAKTLPTPDEVAAYRQTEAVRSLMDEARFGCQYLPDLLHLRAKQLLAEGNVTEAWLTLLVA
ncbi:flavin reductase family protein [Rudanella paleaurantiibacter]|uniref:Flavin reductase family protein n=1 Tax=Rudanella paleaurantiibacter TaxID=2614655 RepID=A0A7J5U1D6_9BACT|nr:flavin reductase family protein [Rudanella paleaurantiibacter]KAB7731351.1 flavin reductase family protein [Rudanella paleaurantiibacter]